MSTGQALEPWGWHAFFTTWQLHGPWLMAGLVVLAAYLYGEWVARREGGGVSWVRVACFVAGVALLEVSIGSSINAYAMAIFWVHMVLHLVLIMVVPALLVLGHPITVLADALAPPERGLLLGALHSRPGAVLTHPLVGLGVYTVVIVGTHLTGFMDDMAMHSWLMGAEQVLYVVAGYWLLLPLIGNEPIRWRMPYLVRIGVLLVAMVPDTVVGVVLLQTETDLFPMMMGMHPAWAPDPVHDLQVGGGLMWAAGDGLMMCFAVGVLVAFISGRDGEDRTFGVWLESVRRQTLVDHVADGSGEALARDIDPDGDDALAAYNRMLGHLNDH